MADLREEFVMYIVKSLVSNPDAVHLERLTDDKGEYIALTVDAADMGKVIGKAGGTAKSIRTLLRVVGARDDLAPLPLKIVEPEGHEPPHQVAQEQVAEVAHQEPAAEPAEEAYTEEAPVEEAPAEETQTPEAEAEEDDHAKKHKETKKEMEELADLEL